ncbi:MAG: F0F1 ATP synthase subunit gamma [Dysgonamonadaceae bacterium]|jgi:F-type H+-transporting ATPase subunit gamma|nr:F0F1 ATP synthase subunit gamma [Dysgonamonadaceae bacterium]
MASLKEIKGRIASVKSTQKITAAMKMVASAKLRKAQYQIERFLPYENRLTDILNRFLSSASEEFNSPLSETREVKRVAIVVLSSNSSLCGAFNSNIIRLLAKALEKYRKLNCETAVYPIGKKVEEAVRKWVFPVEIAGSYLSLIDKPHFDGAKAIADGLIADFLTNKVDRVELIYNHFKSTAVQVPMEEIFLPVILTDKSNGKNISTDYLIEPDRETLLNTLIPKSLRSKIYAILLDSAAAEQAARTVAMQIATDNADEILDGLTIQFNKQRQQAITSELLDIIGGSEALK